MGSVNSIWDEGEARRVKFRLVTYQNEQVFNTVSITADFIEYVAKGSIFG